tara:strand:- start:392 stop:613 length:222 start_codon:yes stop_codon:yes gene_type:complete
MNITARIDRDKLIFYNVLNGAIKSTVSLPQNCTYTGPIITGENVTVSIHYTNGSNRSRTYNIKTSSLVSDIQM